MIFLCIFFPVCPGIRKNTNRTALLFSLGPNELESMIENMMMAIFFFVLGTLFRLCHSIYLPEPLGHWERERECVYLVRCFFCKSYFCLAVNFCAPTKKKSIRYFTWHSVGFLVQVYFCFAFFFCSGSGHLQYFVSICQFLSDVYAGECTKNISISNLSVYCCKCWCCCWAARRFFSLLLHSLSSFVIFFF